MSKKGKDLIRVTIKDSDDGKTVKYVIRNDLEGIVGMMKSILTS